MQHASRFTHHALEDDMLPKPAHLGDEYGAQFSDASVVAAYPHRLPYPPAVFPILAGLIGAGPRVVLDVGCGTGDIARGLVPRVARVDAIDISRAMIELGKTLPGGDDPRLRWTLGRAESVVLDPPYGLVTAGESIHWMPWEVVLPRLSDALVPAGVLAIVGRSATPSPWSDALPELLKRYSTNREYQPYNITDELVGRGLFTPLGETETAPVAARQSIATYVESIHSRNGFSRDRMTEEAATAFDRAVAALVAPFVRDGALDLQTTAHVIWGLPHGV